MCLNDNASSYSFCRRRHPERAVKRQCYRAGVGIPEGGCQRFGHEWGSGRGESEERYLGHEVSGVGKGRDWYTLWSFIHLSHAMEELASPKAWLHVSFLN